jgi:hypothetical protein
MPLLDAVGRGRQGRLIFDWLHQLVHFATPRVADYFVLVMAVVEFVPLGRTRIPWNPVGFQTMATLNFVH